MTKSPSVVERALFTALLGVLAAGVLYVIPATTSPAAAGAPATRVPARSASAPATLYNETFEYGTRGWSSSQRAKLTTVREGRQSRRAARISAKRSGVLVARSTARARDLRGSRHVVTAWLRSTRGRVPARLVVREVEPRTGKVLKARRDQVRVGKRWERVRVRVHRRSETSVLRVAVRTRMKRKDRVLLDDVKVRRTRPGRTKPRAPKTPKTPTPKTPTPTPTDVAGTLTNGCTYSSRGIPACGAYMGAAYGSNSDPAPMESATGHRLGVRRTYFQGHQVDKAVSVSKADLAAGRLPWISFKLPHSWEEMAAGKGDAWARDLATKLKALGGPVWVAFHHEPEKDGDIKAWRSMQERLGPLVRKTAPNVAFTVIATGWNQLYGPQEYRLENMWPRTKVDVSGFDVYNFHMTTHSDGRRMTKKDDIKAGYFDKFSAWAAKNDTRWALAETGQTDESFAVDPGWMEQTHQQMVATGGIAMAYFNTALNSGGNTFPVTSPAKTRAFGRVQDKAPELPRH